MRRGLGTLLVISAVGLCSACSGDDRPAGSPDASSPSPTSPSPTSTQQGQVSPTDLPRIPRVLDSEGVVADAEVGRCSVEAGSQQVRGTVTNTADRPRDVVVVLSWVTETSDVLARGVAVLDDVDPGADARFSVSAQVPEGATQCTRYVVRGEVRG